MTSQRTIRDHLNDMIDAAAKARAFVGDTTREQFLGDEKTAYAVVRALEIIGEAAKRIPQGVRDTYPEFPGEPLPACATS